MDECVNVCESPERAKEAKEINIRLKSYTIEVNDKEIEVTAQDIKDACENDSPWILRRIFNDDDLLRAALLKITK